jgi:hypothetical protein
MIAVAVRRLAPVRATAAISGHRPGPPIGAVRASGLAAAVISVAAGLPARRGA